MTEQVETHEFDQWVTLLQEAILERERAMYSEKVLAEAKNPHNMCVLDGAEGCGIVFGPCGDTMEVFLRRTIICLQQTMTQRPQRLTVVLGLTHLHTTRV